MQEQTKLPLSSKGKARDDAHWQLGWWDFAHTLDGTRRPLVWSKSSLVYTAHPAEPLVLARHFPSSRHFALPSAPQIVASPANYEPPTVISITQNEDMLFAYFPGRGGDGAGCLWRRGIHLDSWQVREFWTFEQGTGAVTAEWTSTHREWTVTESGASTRLPPRGPSTPLPHTLLLLVTEDHCICICYLPPFVPSLKLVKASLLQAGVSQDAQPKDDTLPSIVGPSLCVAASIYLGYDEPCVLVAMRSKVLPPQRVHESTYTAMSLNMTLDMNDVGPSYEVPLTPEWDLWGEDSMINVCEVRMTMKIAVKGVLTRPLPPIPCSNHHLTDLKFISVPLSGPQKPYLAASFLSFGDYTSAPKSELFLFSFAEREPPSQSPYVSDWTAHLETQQSYDDKALGFVLPSPSRDSLLVGLMNLNGSVPNVKTRVKGGTIGTMHILRLPDLSPDDSWTISPIMSDMTRTCRAVPANVAYSPNRALLCSVSASTFLDSHISVHALPRRQHDGGRPLTSTLLIDLPSLIITAIRSRSSSSDVIHALASPAVPVQTAVDILCEVLLYFNEESPGLRDLWTAEVLSIAGEIYLTKSRRAEEGEDKESLLARWRTIHDIFSLSACTSAFAMCCEDQIYDLDDIWHLVCFSTWFIEFLEKVLRESILAGDEILLSQEGRPAISSLNAPIFVHLVHPYSLGRIRVVLGQVKRFRDHVASLTAKGENAQIAKDVLLDVVDCSGIDLEQMDVVLGELCQSLQGPNESTLQQTLLGSMPHPSLSSSLRAAVEKIAGTGGINRARLFIKPGDLVDGVARLSLVDQHLKDKQRDIVSKGLLLNPSLSSVCVCCEGRSETNLNDAKARRGSVNWRAWERKWRSRCVCGGAWLKLPYIA